VTGNGERLAAVAFVTQAVLAGGNAVGVRYSNRELEPLWGASLRFMLAAVLLLAIMAALRLGFPRGKALGGSALYGLINFGMAFALFYYGMLRVHAGLGQVLLALVPLFALLLAVLWRQERLRAAALLGTLLALAGVALLTRAPLRESVPLLPMLAVVGCAVCFAQAMVLVRRVPRVHPVTMNAVGMTVGAAFLFVGSLIFGETLALPQRTETWVAISFVAVIGSVVVFLLYVFVLQYWVASRAAYGFVIIPFVTVLLSSRLDDESITTGLVFGGLLVLAGVYVGALRPAHVDRVHSELGRAPQA